MIRLRYSNPAGVHWAGAAPNSPPPWGGADPNSPHLWGGVNPSIVESSPNPSLSGRGVSKPFLAALGALVLIVLAGCDSPTASQAVDTENSRLRWLIKVRTHAHSRGNILKSQDDYKRHIQNLEPTLRDTVINGAGVSNVDELFISERDGQPYVIFYGRPPAGLNPDLVGYEQTGVDGKRFVGFGLGVVEEVDEQRFSELVPPAARPKR